MYVVHCTDSAQKEPEIVPLRESSELRYVIQPNVDERSRPGVFKESEETLG